MSRSYKHTPRCGDTKGKASKRAANHAIRRKKLCEDFPAFGGYRKLYESWNICDFESVNLTLEEFCARDPSLDRKEAKKEYSKWYLRK